MEQRTGNNCSEEYERRKSQRSIVPYQPRPFVEGAACSSCPTHCEFHMDKDGEEVEGELCVPPDGYYNDQKAEAAALENISSVGDIVGVSILPIAILLMIWWIRR
ncbi:hypothetical protein CAEBREN_03845 [Caenorhabditis brenneri]|uniref:Uncharacterized protein n=1 Tax=Caenorhabditis brenneri TaxID=135651 RepID=G0MQD5_CAEBE|nr:hypothetical protein CAEBREN_03845 [Caenorhabditis brenneri]